VNPFERLLTLIEEQPLSRSLPTALRVATTIGDEELVSWIRLELMGYVADNPAMREDVVVPEYRGVPGQWYDDYGRALMLSDPGLGFINELRLRHGVAELEGIATGTGLLAIRAPEFSEIIRESLKVHVTVFRFRPSSVSQVLTNVRGRVLDKLASCRENIRDLPNGDVAPQPEVLELKPSFHGMTVDLKALWRRLSGKIRGSV
jgi:hypothetical protein